MTTVVLVALVAGFGLLVSHLLYDGSTERKPPSGPDGRGGFDIWPFF
jgi:hypothetical protein